MNSKKKHIYIVGMNMPGYLPDSDNQWYTNLEDAYAAAKNLKDMFLEDNWDLPRSQQYHVYGNIRRDRRYDVYCEGRGLDYVIWIEEEWVTEEEYTEYTKWM